MRCNVLRSGGADGVGVGFLAGGDFILLALALFVEGAGEDNAGWAVCGVGVGRLGSAVLDGGGDGVGFDLRDVVDDVV